MDIEQDTNADNIEIASLPVKTKKGKKNRKKNNDWFDHIEFEVN